MPTRESLTRLGMQLATIWPSEEGRAMLLDKLEAAGAFRLCVAAMFGGEDLDVSDASRAVEDVAG